MKELLLRWTPRRHDDVAGSSVTIGAVVLCPFEPDHISDERHQRAARISITGIYRFTWTLVFVNIEQKGCLPLTKRRSDEPPILMSFLHRGPLPTVWESEAPKVCGRGNLGLRCRGLRPQ